MSRLAQIAQEVKDFEAQKKEIEQVIAEKKSTLKFINQRQAIAKKEAEQLMAMMPEEEKFQSEPIIIKVDGTWK